MTEQKYKKGHKPFLAALLALPGMISQHLFNQLEPTGLHYRMAKVLGKRSVLILLAVLGSFPQMPAQSD